LLAAGIALAIRAPRADAFCGFYVGGAGAQMFNNATQVVLMRLGTTTVLSMQNNYQGPPEHFAMVVPVPVVVHKDQVKTLPREIFDKVDTLGAPRLVEYWEADPCQEYVEREYGRGSVKYDAEEVADEDSSRDEKKYKVKIEAKFSVGEYDIVVLSAEESTGLDHYLRDNHYDIPAGAEPLLRPYVEQGTKFFVAKVDPSKVQFVNGMATLSPLRFHYDSPEFSLPIRLGLASSPGTQDLIVNVLAPGGARYEVANYKNVTIPTNLVVRDATRTRFAEFYAALFDHTIAEVPGAVVTEYAWSAGSCDPCPGPTLDADDLATLGADVLGSTYREAGSTDFTLTRLHARYGKEISADLVFRSVDAITGGRGIPDEHGALSTEVTRDGTNNFQGRYVMLHPWTGAIACADPKRGRWGGPPDGQQIAEPLAATGTAFAPRGKLELDTMVTSVPRAGLLDSKGLSLPIPVRQPMGCGGCETGGGAAGALGMLGVLGLATRRRRRRR
jgi:MYXO-CTERM domain-containing protein